MTNIPVTLVVGDLYSFGEIITIVDRCPAVFKTIYYEIYNISDSTVRIPN